MFEKILSKILPKEDIMRVDGKIYLRRWTLLRTGKNKFWRMAGLSDIRIYIHKFLKDDEADLHNHPNRFFSFIFKGQYKEWTFVLNKCTKEKIERIEFLESKIYRAPCLRNLPASHAHRIELIDNKPAWSIVLMFPKIKDWGFFCLQKGRRKWIQWKDYNDNYLGKGKCE